MNFKYFYGKYPVDHIEHNGIVYLQAAKLFYLMSNMERLIKNVSKELKNVPKEYIYRESEKGRNAIAYISAEGIIQYLSKKNCYTEIEIENMIMFLRKNKLYYTDNIFISRKEISFKNELIDFFKVFNIEIKHQDNSIDGILIDFVIGGKLAVEYDENRHYAYSKNKELERENIIKQKYCLIRVSDEKTNGHNIGVVYKKYTTTYTQKKNN